MMFEVISCILFYNSSSFVVCNLEISVWISSVRDQDALLVKLYFTFITHLPFVVFLSFFFYSFKLKINTDIGL